MNTNFKKKNVSVRNSNFMYFVRQILFQKVFIFIHGYDYIVLNLLFRMFFLCKNIGSSLILNVERISLKILLTKSLVKTYQNYISNKI